MARELSVTLKEQQKWALISWPYLIAKIRRKWGGVIRYDWESLYSGEEDNAPHTATMPTDGSLIRLRIDDPAIGKQLFYQRTTNPNPESDFSDWTSTPRYYIEAVASASLGSYVSQFYVHTLGYLYQRVSDDNGASWGAWTNIHSYWTLDCLSLDAAYKANGDICVIFPSVTRKCEYADTGDVGNILVANPIQAGQSFSPVVTHSLDHVELKLWREGSPGTAYLYLYQADGSGYPAGGALASISFDSMTITTESPGLWYSFNLFYPTMTKDANYCIVLVCPDGTETDYLAWRYNGSNPYARGLAIVSYDGGSIWQQQADFDRMFREYGYHSKPGNPVALLYHETNGKTWELQDPDNQTPKPCTGMSLYHTDDWNIVGTYGGEDNEKGVAICIFGDGVAQEAGTWSPWDDIISRESTEPYNYNAPCVRRADTTRLYFVENFTQEELQNRLYYSHSPEASIFYDNAWLEPVPMNVQSEYGLSFTQCGSYAWLTNANKVYRALATDDELDITAKLLEVDMRQYPDIRKGYMKVTIDNTNGQYNSFARMGDELTIGLGYKTPAGNEYSLASSFWITKYRLESPPWYPLRMIFPTGIIGTLVIEAQDCWDFLKRYKARRTLNWDAGDKSVLKLLTYFLARAGITFEVQSASSAAQNFKPEFQVSRGTTYRTIVKNLMKMIPDQLIFREYKAILRDPSIEEGVDWTYHNLLGQANLVYRGRYGSSAWDPNRAEVWGDTFMKMEAEWPQVQKVRDRMSRITESVYPDLTRAGERAVAELTRSEILTGAESWLNAPTNCGLEPWDTLKITDLVGGVSNIYRRAIRIKTYWNRRHWQYHQVLTLGAIGAEIYPPVTRREYYITGDNLDAITWDDNWLGQTFTHAQAHTITKVKLKLRRKEGAEGTLTIGIRATSEGLPTGPDLTSATLDISSLTTISGGEWYTIQLPPHALAATTMYAIVVRGPVGEENEVYWRIDLIGATYANGAACGSDDGGDSWDEVPDADFMFEEWGY